jgi:prepilin peptidase CpaA
VIWHWVTLGVLAIVLIAAAVSDLRRGKVFNWITYPALVAGLVLAVAEGAAGGEISRTLIDHLLGLGFGFGVMFAAYVLGGMGGGDVKLMAAVGLMTGWPDALYALVYAFMVAAALGLILMIWKGRTRTVIRRLWIAVRILPLPTAKMSEAVPEDSIRVPFGFAACVGVMWFEIERVAGGTLWNAAGSLLGG